LTGPLDRDHRDVATRRIVLESGPGCL